MATTSSKLVFLTSSNCLQPELTIVHRQTPRGIRGYTLLSTSDPSVDFSHWKIQGNLGGEDFPDKVRGPLNEGGLFVERQGAHLPGFPITSTGWITSSSSTPYTGISTAGIRAYRTTFDLSLPTNVDIPIALKFTRTPSSSYRSVVYINGWQFGRFNSKDGPQEIFPVSDHTIRENTITDNDVRSFPKVF